MTPEIDQIFADVKDRHGAGSITRVEEMVYAKRQERHPLQKDAKWIMPGISRTPWHDPYEHPEIEPVVRAFEAGHGAIKQELADAWSDRKSAFSDYEHYLSRQENWQALYLFRDGGPVESSADLVPTAYTVLTREVIEQGALPPPGEPLLDAASRCLDRPALRPVELQHQFAPCGRHPPRGVASRWPARLGTGRRASACSSTTPSCTRHGTRAPGRAPASSSTCGTRKRPSRSVRPSSVSSPRSAS